jgi:hypothetical protein
MLNWYKNWKQRKMNAELARKNEPLLSALKKAARKVSLERGNSLTVLSENLSSVTVQPLINTNGSLRGPLPSELKSFMEDLKEEIKTNFPENFPERKVEVEFHPISFSASETYGISLTILA